MSALAIVLIVIAVVLVALFAAGLAVARRRSERPSVGEHIAAADRALEQARAEDRGWNRQLLHDAARRALQAEHPTFEWRSLELVLVDDRPGVEEDRAHVMAVGSDTSVRVILARDKSGSWAAERLE